MVTNISMDYAQQIVNTIKGVCGHNINFIDRNGYILASTDPSRVGAFHEIGSKVVASGKAIEVAVSDQYTGTRRGINLPIYHNRECIAVVGISGDPEEVRPFCILAQRVTSLLIREQEISSIATNQSEQRSYILNAFLRREITNQQYLEELLTQFQVDTRSPKRIVLIRMNNNLPASVIASIEYRTLDILQQLNVKLYMRQYPNDLISVIDDHYLTKALRLLKELASNHHDILRVSIGKATALADLSSSNDCARIAIKAITNRDCPFMLFDDLKLDLVLSSLSCNRKQEYLQKTIGGLDQEEIELLRKYYLSNMSLSQTAAELYLHKNTVQYKLNRIHEKTQLNPRSFQDAVLLYLAICMEDQDTENS